jgi:hypothetical protein
MDLYIALFNVYSDYNLKQIYITKKNIRNLLYKILNEKIVKYLPYLEEFFKNLIFKMISHSYQYDTLFKNHKLLNDYICDYLKFLSFNGVISKDKISQYIIIYEEKILKETAIILSSFKQLEEQEENTIGQIDLPQ